MTVEWWSVYLQACDPETDQPLDPADARWDEFLDALSAHDGVVGGADDRWDARVSVQAYDAGEALEFAQDLIVGAAAEAGLPVWPVVRLEAVTDAELERVIAEPNFPDLAGVAEVAELLRVSKQRVSALAKTNPDFPKPMVVLASGPVWLRAAVDAFLARWERRPGPRRAEQAC